jgi:hypothetical protein
MEPFAEGDAVTLNDAVHALGHIVRVSADRHSVQVRWQHRPGHDHDVTVEPVEKVRRVHEPDEP